MALKASENSSFPRVYETWETDDAKWTVQDLLPEDDENVIDLLVNSLCPDEVLCASCGLYDNAESVKGISDFWRENVVKRTSIACYKEVDGIKTLVGANVCLVANKDDECDPNELTGDIWRNVYRGLDFLKTKTDPYEYLGVDNLLIGMGLVVRKDCRGAKLGSKILNAREPLCKQLGIKATSTVFTGIRSQISAARSGFISIAEATLSEMAEAGLNYPKDDYRVIKLMVKRYT